ncbi:hypothetical protein [Brevibacterium aurantiacum]|uniref:Uncharacterized protein n=1 Tax=Brevibacterium aurantiacum TaxID=273384 RepID=A0A2H1IK38_BREAU|nr:hypothetical protein [Brevibacterium aurantiacum]SMX75506.1 hypothetical protein BAURA63_01303 [Brevibacterium aurantiacum]
MNVEQEIHTGYTAWLPSPRATELDVWVDDHVPMVGTFVSEGSTIAFSAIFEPKETASVWIYAALTADEASFLDDHIFEDATEADSYLDNIFANRTVTYAATRDFRIRQFMSLELEGRSIAQGAIDFLTSVSAALALGAHKDSEGHAEKTPEMEQIGNEAEHFKHLVSA